MSTQGQQNMLAEGRRMRSLAGQSLIYGMSGVIGRFAGFFLVPIYLHAAGAKAYGTVDLMLSAVLLASILLRMGIVTTMSRFTLGEGETDWAPIIHTIFVFVMTAATLGVLIGWVFRGFIGHVLQVDTDIVLAGLFGLWISMNYDVMARVYRIERRARSWVRFTLLNILLTTILTLLLVVVFDQGALGLLIGNFTGTALVYLLVVVARRHTIGIRRFDRPVLRDLLTYSLPLMPANIALWALNLADRIQVQRLAGHQELGTYSVAARVGVPVLVLMGAFQTAWAPFAHDVRGQEGDDQAKRTYASVLTYWSVVMGWGLVAISLTAPPYIGYFLPKNTQGAMPVVTLLAAGTVLYGGYLIVNIGVTISRRTRMTPLIASAAAAVNLGLNFWAIPHWGIVGAGLTTVLGYALLLWMGWANSQRSYPVPYEWLRVGKVAADGGAAAGAVAVGDPGYGADRRRRAAAAGDGVPADAGAGGRTQQGRCAEGLADHRAAACAGARRPRRPRELGAAPAQDPGRGRRAVDPHAALGAAAGRSRARRAHRLQPGRRGSPRDGGHHRPRPAGAGAADARPQAAPAPLRPGHPPAGGERGGRRRARPWDHALRLLGRAGGGAPLRGQPLGPRRVAGRAQGAGPKAGRFAPGGRPTTWS